MMDRAALPASDAGEALALDHLVINTRFEIEQAVRVFATLGFTLTPRSRHTLGSVNHLMVFGTDYLELIGLPDDGGPLREEILNSPCGIDGLVFQDADVDSMARRVGSLADALAPVGQFSRPVALDEGTRDASFRTARFVPGRFEAGRVYYCQHLTPDLIWRSAWQHHANTARCLSGMVIVSADPAREATAYAQAALSGAPVHVAQNTWQVQGSGYALTLCDRDTYLHEYAELACEANGRDAWFGAINILVDDLSMLQRVVGTLGDAVQYRSTPNRLVVSLAAFNAVLDFSTEPATRPAQAF